MHRTIFIFLAQKKIDTEKVVHTDCTKKIHTKFFVRRNFAQKSFYTAETFPHRSLSGQILLNAQQFLQRDGFYTESSPRRSLTHRRFYAQHSLHTDFHTQMPLHGRRIAHSTLLHATSFYRERFCFPFLITYLSCSPSQVCLGEW